MKKQNIFILTGLIFIIIFFALPKNLEWLKDVLSLIIAIMLILQAIFLTKK